MYFQAKFIRQSTRKIRGRVARIQNIRKIKKKTFSVEHGDRDHVGNQEGRSRFRAEDAGIVQNPGMSPLNGRLPPPRKRTVVRQLTAKARRYVAAKKKKPEAHPREVLGVIAGDDLRLRLGEVE